MQKSKFAMLHYRNSTDIIVGTNTTPRPTMCCASSWTLVREILNGLLDERAPVFRLAPYVVISDAETDHHARHQHAVIHVFGRRGCDGGPEAPEEDEEDVEDCEGVVGYAEDTGDAPEAPLEWGMNDFVIMVEGRISGRLRAGWVGFVVMEGIG